MNEAAKLVKTLQAKGLTIAFAESVTCGLAAHKLSSVKGTSDVLRASIVCYQADMKSQLLDVTKQLIKNYTCESQEVTEALVRGLQKKIDADIHAGITGLAAPGGSETKSKPVGTVFISVFFKRKIYNKRFNFRGTPAQIKNKACMALYKFVLTVISKS